MLEITIPARELYDEVNEVFINTKETTLRLEHSLVSISKWETKWKKPFLKPDYRFTPEEFRDYIKCMTINQNIADDLYLAIGNNEMAIIRDYINDNKTATVINDRKKQGKSRDIITSELIYYWMVAYQIPFECQKWHLSRLLTLIKICTIKNSKGDPMSKSEILAQNRKLNEARKKAMGTRG